MRQFLLFVVVLAVTVLGEYRGLRGFHKAAVRSSNSREFHHSFDHTDVTGRRTSLRYKLSVAEQSLLLDEDLSVDSIRCNEDGTITLDLNEAVSSSARAKLQHGGQLIGSGEHFGSRCGAPEGLARSIISADVSPDLKSVTVHTRAYSRLEDAFGSWDIEFHADDAMDSSSAEELVAQENVSGGNSRQLMGIGGWIKDTAQKVNPFQPFNYEQTVTSPYLGANVDPATGSVKVPDYELWKSGAQRISCKNCYASFRPTVSFKLTGCGICTSPGVDILQVIISGEVIASVSVQADVGLGDRNFVTNLFRSPKISIPGLSLSIFGFTVGLTAQIPLNGEIQLSTQGTVSISAGASFRADGNFVVRAGRQSGCSDGFGPCFTQTFNQRPSYDAPSIKGVTTATAKVWLKPQLVVAVSLGSLDIISASLEFGAYIQARVGFGVAQGCNANNGASYQLSYGVEISGNARAELATTWFKWGPRCLNSKCEPLKIWGIGPVAISSGCVNIRLRDVIETAGSSAELRYNGQENSDSCPFAVSGTATCTGSTCTFPAVDTCAAGSVGMQVAPLSQKQVALSMVVPEDGQYLITVNSWPSVGTSSSSYIASFISDTPCGHSMASSQPVLSQGSTVVVVIGGTGSACGVLNLSIVKNPNWVPHIWVSAVGSDATGTGSSTLPVQTLAKALAITPAGGVIVFRNGTYTLTGELAVTNSVTITSQYPQATVAHMAAYAYDSFNTWKHPDEIGTAFDTVLVCSGNFRAFSVAPSVSFSFLGLTLAGCGGGSGNNGGAIYAAGTPGQVINLVIASAIFRPVVIRPAECTGSCLCLPATNGIATTCIYAAPSAVNAAQGGSVFISGPGSTLSVTDTLFLGQGASQAGGAIAATNQASISVSSCDFWQNFATGSGSGGAIYLGSAATAAISQASFLNNTASVGGAVAFDNAIGSMDTTEFKANAATLSGGAFSAVSSNMTSTSNVFKYNFAAAGTGAGAVYLSASSMNMQWGYLSNNTAPALSVESGSSVVLNTTEILSSLAATETTSGASVKCSSSFLDLVDNDISGARSTASGNLVNNIACDACTGTCVSCGACPLCSLCSSTGECDAKSMSDYCSSLTAQSSCMAGFCDATTGACGSAPIYNTLDTSATFPYSNSCGYFSSSLPASSFSSGAYQGSIDRTWKISAPASNLPTVLVFNQTEIGNNDRLTVFNPPDATGYSRPIATYQGPQSSPVMVVASSSSLIVNLATINDSNFYFGLQANFMPAAYEIAYLRVVLDMPLPQSAISENEKLLSPLPPSDSALFYPEFTGEVATEVALAANIPRTWVRSSRINVTDTTVTIDLEMLPDPLGSSGKSPLAYVNHIADLHEQGWLNTTQMPYLSKIKALELVSDGTVATVQTTTPMTSGVKAAAVVGIAFGCFAFGVILVAVPAFLLLRKRRERRAGGDLEL